MATDPQRLVRIKTSLGANKFMLRDMNLMDPLGQCFTMELTVDSDDLNVDFKKILGDHLTVEFDLSDTERRYFDGIVTGFAYVGIKEARAVYNITLRPWLWLLGRHVQCKILQGKTVPDIIKETFRAANFDDFEDELQRTDYVTLDYCVQYRESDLAFVSRLMEQEGIYYYFKHTDGVHKLVLCDGSASHQKYDKYGDLKFARDEDSDTAGTLYDWSIVREIQSGQYTHTDYDLEKPNADLKRSKSITQSHKLDKFEIYDYPGKYTDVAAGQTYAGIRMEEQAAQFEHATAKSKTRWIGTGYIVELKDSLREDQNKEYLVTETHILIRADAAAGGPQIPFLVEFKALENAQNFRSPRRTPKPFIRGPQTAMVVGQSGQEIWTDKYGRVKVQFHWDRDGQHDEKSSCWIRCAQSWAGKQWGGMFIPRIGQEVVVHFLEGDPDRPLITGAVYNASAMPPYSLPDKATQSTIKSNSSQGGNGSNEIRFEDKAGSEEFFEHAQKDMNIEVEHDRTVTVKTGDETKDVKQGKQTTTVFGDTALTVKTGNRTVSVSEGNYTVDVTLGSGSIKAMQAITIESTLGITLKVGPNSISIDMTGIKVNGMLVSVQGQTMTTVSGQMTNIQGAGILELAGGILMIG